MWVSRYIVIMHIGRIVLGKKIEANFQHLAYFATFPKNINIFFDGEILIFSIEQNFSFLKAKILKAKNVNKEEILIWQKVSVFTEKKCIFSFLYFYLFCSWSVQMNFCRFYRCPSWTFCTFTASWGIFIRKKFISMS